MSSILWVACWAAADNAVAARTRPRFGKGRLIIAGVSSLVAAELVLVPPASGPSAVGRVVPAQPEEASIPPGCSSPGRPTGRDSDANIWCTSAIPQIRRPRPARREQPARRPEPTGVAYPRRLRVCRFEIRPARARRRRAAAFHSILRAEAEEVEEALRRPRRWVRFSRWRGWIAARRRQLPRAR